MIRKQILDLPLFLRNCRIILFPNHEGNFVPMPAKSSEWLFVIHSLFVIPLQGDALCKDCFFVTFEKEVHHTIISNKLFSKGQVVAIGASGGKGTCKAIKLCSFMLVVYSFSGSISKTIKSWHNLMSNLKVHVK